MLQTPRFIKRCIENIETKKNILDGLGMVYYTPAQIITLGYIITNTKYLFLIGFIENNIDYVIRDYISTQRIPGSQESVKSWIAKDYPSREEEWESSFKLMRCLSKAFEYYLKSDNYDVFKMSKSLDSPENLKNCLSGINKSSHYQRLLSLADLLNNSSSEFKKISDIDFIQLVKFLLRTKSVLLNNPIFIADFERRLMLKHDDTIFHLLIELINKGNIPVVNYLPILAYYISDFSSKKLFIIALMKSLIVRDPTLINDKVFVRIFKTFFKKYKESKLFDLDDDLYAIIDDNFRKFIVELGEESFIIYKRMILNKKGVQIGFSLLDKIHMSDDNYFLTIGNKFWGYIINFLYELDLSYFDENYISQLLEWMNDEFFVNNLHTQQQFSFLNKLIFSKYFILYSERIKKIIIHRIRTFDSKLEKECDPISLVYNFLKVCFYGEKLSIEVGYTMLKEFTDRLNDIVDVFDAENIILMFIMVIESGNVNFDQKHEILSLFNSAYYEKTIKYRDVWARLANSYYRVFEETYIKNKEIIYNNSYALHILRDYLDPSDEKILANTREVAERGLEEYHNYITYYWKAYKLDIPAIIPANLNIKEIEAEYAKIIMPFGKLMEISKRIKINIEPYEKILPSTDDHILDNNSLIRYKIRY